MAQHNTVFEFKVRYYNLILDIDYKIKEKNNRYFLFRNGRKKNVAMIESISETSILNALRHSDDMQDHDIAEIKMQHF